MPRTFLSALGVLFMALALFIASFLGNIAVGLQRQKDAYASRAIDVVRELSRSGGLSSFEKNLSKTARTDMRSALDTELHNLKLLGPLLATEGVSAKPGWLLPFGQPVSSPGELTDRLAALVNRVVRVRFKGRFAGGFAMVTAELCREGGTVKLRRLWIDTPEKSDPTNQPERQVISHA